MGNAVNTSECLPLVNDIVESIDRNADALISLCRLKTRGRIHLHAFGVGVRADGVAGPAARA